MSDVLQALGSILVIAGLWLWLGVEAGLIASGVVLLVAGEAV